MLEATYSRASLFGFQNAKEINKRNSKAASKKKVTEAQFSSWFEIQRSNLLNLNKLVHSAMTMGCAVIWNQYRKEKNYHYLLRIDILQLLSHILFYSNKKKWLEEERNILSLESIQKVLIMWNSILCWTIRESLKSCHDSSECEHFVCCRIIFCICPKHDKRYNSISVKKCEDFKHVKSNFFFLLTFTEIHTRDIASYWLILSFS